LKDRKYDTETYFNKKYGRLTPIEIDKNHGNRKTFWVCQCDCGNVVVVPKYDLISGKSCSCGCLRKELTSIRKKHEGTENKRLYNIWKNMRQRCLNPTSPASKNYLKRGIKICDEWMESYTSFYKWALNNGYQDDLTIDRIDNDGDYCPENCRWVDRGVQARNKRGVNNIAFNGKTQCIAEWAREMGLVDSCLEARLKKGWSIEKALLTPSKGKRND
jgi:hypothetical protein